MASPPTPQRKSAFRSRIGGAMRSAAALNPATPPPPQDSDTASMAGSVSGKLERQGSSTSLKKIDTIPEEPGSSAAKSETHSNNGGGDLLEVEAPSNVPFDYDESPPPASSVENRPLDSTPEEPRESGSSETHSDNGNGDLLEVEAPSNVPVPQFDYDDASSLLSSVNSREDEVPPLDPFHSVPQSSDTPPVTSPTEPYPQGNHNVVESESSQSLRSFKRWLQTKIRRSKKDPGLHEPNRRSGKSRRPAAAVRRSPSQSAERVDVTDEGISHMAETRRVPRAVAKPVVKRQPKSPAKAAGPRHRNKKASHSGKRPAGAAQQVNNPSPPTTGTVRVSRESDKAILSIACPGWMCFGSSTGDGTH